MQRPLRIQTLAIQSVRTIAILLVATLVLIGILAFLEHALVYHPHSYRPSYRKLSPAGMVELEFKTAAGRQTAFYLPPCDHGSFSAHVWVAFCGNGSLALDWLPLVIRDRNPRNAFLLVDYPGYGKSEGSANIASTRAAAEGALTSLAAHLGIGAARLEPNLNVLGHSLGAAAALDFSAHHEQVNQVILVAPFTSMREEAALFIGAPLSHLLRENYDNRAALRQLAQRHPPPHVVIFHGLADGLIPAKMGRELAEEFSTCVTFHAVPDATHDTVVAESADDVLALLAADGETRLER
jgi:pimeloyl-ACP methyl ester carboxylesterase